MEEQQPPQASVEPSPYVQSRQGGLRKFVEAVRARSFINVTSWVLLFLLAPATILVLISQNTVPGDFFYPVKRGLEDVILAGASLNPTTKAVFRVDLTRRRFDEAEKLLLASANTAGLSELVSEIQATQVAVAKVSDPAKKQELEQKLLSAYGEYEKRLVAVRVQLEAQGQVPPTPPEVVSQPTATPPPAGRPTSPPGELPRPTNTPVPVPTSLPGQPPRPTNTPVPLPTRIPTPQPTATPPPSIPTSPPIRATPTPTSPQAVPTTEPTSLPTQIPSPTPAPPPTTTGGAVDATIEYLQCLRTRPANECRAPALPSSSAGQPSSAGQQDHRRGQSDERRGEQRVQRREEPQETPRGEREGRRGE